MYFSKDDLTFTAAQVIGQKIDLSVSSLYHVVPHQKCKKTLSKSADRHNGESVPDSESRATDPD